MFTLLRQSNSMFAGCCPDLTTILFLKDRTVAKSDLLSSSRMEDMDWSSTGNLCSDEC